ncbi:hypothetical protein AK812_SmicGene6738 [Symbiodinium microadriaticum]|uniref:Uncharacterized protein n=1 Tax=Symbiodinium microadriaticum TaxID=2951 RepID=A0A1Q9EQF0_SYMMI|nr:hypothetical protein AK812_SmicGene6738 [Symbiodinium microadriaticum]
MNNSTDALVQLWNMCVTSQGSCPEQGLQWDTLRRVMEGLPVARCEALKTNSVDEILSYHFGPHAAGGVLNYVNFTLFWHGMEAILQVFNHRGFDDGTLQVIASLRHFRDAVLELPGAFGGSLDEQPLAECSVRKTFAPRCTQGAIADRQAVPGKMHPPCHVRELRILYDQLHDQGLLSGSGAVAEYWADKLRQLPKDEENLMVSADEISAALLQWLEDLLGYAEGSEDASSEEPEQELTPEVFAARSLLKKPEAQCSTRIAPIASCFPEKGQDARRATGATGRLSWLLKPDVAENVEVKWPNFAALSEKFFRMMSDISLRDFYRGVRAWALDGQFASWELREIDGAAILAPLTADPNDEQAEIVENVAIHGRVGLSGHLSHGVPPPAPRDVVPIYQRGLWGEDRVAPAGAANKKLQEDERDPGPKIGSIQFWGLTKAMEGDAFLPERDWPPQGRKAYLDMPAERSLSRTASSS